MCERGERGERERERGKGGEGEVEGDEVFVGIVSWLVAFFRFVVVGGLWFVVCGWWASGYGGDSY